VVAVYPAIPTWPPSLSFPWKRNRKKLRRAPRLEQLEDRTVPSTFYVTNTGDNGGINPLPGAGTGTLRQAIIDANATPNVSGPDLIAFNISLTDPNHFYYRPEHARHWPRYARPCQRGWNQFDSVHQVTLSACESGLGRQGGGDGLLGFAQAFLLARSRSVCLTLWQVDDTATMLLMDRFYRNLLGKRADGGKPMGKAAALQEAKLWLCTLPVREAEERLRTLTKGVVRSQRPARPGRKMVCCHLGSAQALESTVRPPGAKRFCALYSSKIGLKGQSIAAS
jgi:hypothetical protein